MEKFTCPRTCPQAGAFWCRFRPVLDLLGPVRVNSHTAQMKVEYRDLAALKSAVEAMGGTWIGPGCHKLYEASYSGNAFKFSSWKFPCVLDASGTLQYDNFGGTWGNADQLDKLKSAYTLSVAEQAALAQGWQCQREGDKLTVYHPSGGTLTIDAQGSLDANGFVGTGCHDAIMQLGLPMSSMQAKPEYGQVKAENHLSA